MYISVFMPVPCYFDYSSFVVQFAIRDCDTSHFVLSQSFFGFVGSLWFHIHFRISSSSEKNVMDILRWIELNLYIVLGSKDIVFLISSSDCSLLIYRNVTDFCMLILYFADLLNSFITFNFFFLVESLGFSLYSIMSPANSDNFTSSLPVQMSFISLSYLIVVAWTSNCILKRSDETEHPCLVSDLVVS